MRDYLEKLLSLLDHKYDVLQELIERQEGFKQFLIKPDWPRFYEVTAPQEKLLTRLRQTQSAQDYLLTELGKRLRLTGTITIKGLCPCLEPEWQRALLTSAEKLREPIQKLRELTRMSQMLNQVQWRFLRETDKNAANDQQLSSYTHQGYAARSSYENRFTQEV